MPCAAVVRTVGSATDDEVIAMVAGGVTIVSTVRVLTASDTVTVMCPAAVCCGPLHAPTLTDPKIRTLPTAVPSGLCSYAMLVRPSNALKNVSTAGDQSPVKV